MTEVRINRPASRGKLLQVPPSRLYEDQCENIKKLVDAGIYKSGADFLRDAIDEKLYGTSQVKIVITG